MARAGLRDAALLDLCVMGITVTSTHQQHETILKSHNRDYYTENSIIKRIDFIIETLINQGLTHCSLIKYTIIKGMFAHEFILII